VIFQANFEEATFLR